MRPPRPFLEQVCNNFAVAVLSPSRRFFFLATGKLTGHIFVGAEHEGYPTRPDGVRRRDFFAAAILRPSRRIFFWPLEAAGDFIVFKNAILIRLITGAIFSGKNFATVGFSSHP